MSDLTYVRVGGKWNYVCLLVDLHNREIVGHAASGRKDAGLVKAAFATLGFPPADINVLRANRGSEFANPGIDDLLEAFDIRRSLSRKGNPYDNTVIESTNRILKKELVYRRAFTDLGQLRRELNPCVRWRNEERMHSTLGYRAQLSSGMQDCPCEKCLTSCCKSSASIPASRSSASSSKTTRFPSACSRCSASKGRALRRRG